MVIILSLSRRWGNYRKGNSDQSSCLLQMCDEKGTTSLSGGRQGRDTRSIILLDSQHLSIISSPLKPPICTQSVVEERESVVRLPRLLSLIFTLDSQSFVTEINIMQDGRETNQDLPF